MAEITEEKVSKTAAWLRDSVWVLATNPASKPVVRAMADATERRDWASLRILADALEALEALTCGLHDQDVRRIADRAGMFARQELLSKARQDHDEPEICAECEHTPPCLLADGADAPCGRPAYTCD